MDNRDALDLALVSEHNVDFSSLESAVSEDAFLRESFELLKEAMGLLTLVASTLDEHHSEGFSRNEAILVGHLVRMVKLMRSVVRGVADDHGGDQQSQLVRQFLDSASILKYLLYDVADESRFDAYIFDSLIGEREFLKNIRQVATGRGGPKLNIEMRIERSIRTTLQSAGVKEEDVPSRKKINWPNAETRLKLLGPTAYSAYRTGSGSIHGSWHDLERNHLEQVDGKFHPLFNAAPERPQPLFTMALVSIVIAKEYVSKCIPAANGIYGPRFDNYLAKLDRADSLHEDYLTDKSRSQLDQDLE